MAVTSKAISNISKTLLLNGLLNGGGYTSSPYNYAGITKIYAYDTSTLKGSDDIAFNTIVNGATTLSGTPVLNITAGNSVNKLVLMNEAYNTSLAEDEWIDGITFNIDTETFTYAGSITITSCSLSISNTVS